MDKRSLLDAAAALLFLAAAPAALASPAIMKENCAECHNDDKSKGKFNLRLLGKGPNPENLDYWLEALDLVTAEEMPPEDDSELSAPDREKLVAFIESKLKKFREGFHEERFPHPRRLNNREFANSVRDALQIEDIGTHLPADNLIGDTLHHGFDTHGATLGFSRFHLEQYIETARKIVDATILSGEKPESRRHQIPAESILRRKRNRIIQRGKDGVFDFYDPLLTAYFEDFRQFPTTGRYKIKIRAIGRDRLVYETSETGFYHGDPIQLRVVMGDRVRTFDLPDEEETVIELDEWIAAGTRIELKNPTDAYRMKGNGNFKFQYAIAGAYLKENDPERYAKRVAEIGKGDPNKPRNKKSPASWHHWGGLWEGSRPQVFGVEIEGPFYESWPSKRQLALIGDNPSTENAAQILKPIAQRAWRRPVRDGELDDILALVRSTAESLGEIEALKEGIVAVLVSPAFLILNSEDRGADDRFAAKLSYFLHSSLPDEELRNSVKGDGYESFETVRSAIQEKFAQSEADDFLRAFPFAWLELNDINFMAPDPDLYRFYHRKRLSEDMIEEVMQFFRHMVESNLPIPEFISADYSFINADLAQIYQIDEVPQDSKFRKHTFTDGRRGGLLGMSAFLTATADSLATSPIHRAVYVMENFMGIHPTPPPPNLEINEPDVRQAKTIKEILAAHTSDPNCASCHESIDPWGYAFESFDPTGAWRDGYIVPTIVELDKDGDPLPSKKKGKQNTSTIPIDASAKFRNGAEYEDIVGFRQQILTDANRDRFVRCFIAKLLTYANGFEPSDADFHELDNILAKSAENEYRIVDTIAAVIDSPLFREQ